MSDRAASRSELLWLAPLLLGALALRLWGVRHGLPFIYNADENAHFVPRAIGMFGHSYNPGYFINPPGFTYLLHVVFAISFGGREGVSDAFAANPSAVFTTARGMSAILGATAVGFLYLAGRELTGDRRAGWIAAALLAVAFLPVHYAHFALNDVPALAPLCLALWGAARVYRRGGWVDFAIGGIGLGLACAFKYTTGIVLLVLLAAAALSLAAPPQRRALGAALMGGCALIGFLVANPYALLDYDTFRDGLEKQSEASSDGGGKLGLTESNGAVYYLKTLVWGFGIVPLMAAAGGVAQLLVRDRRVAALLLPAPLFFLWFMGRQDRFFARWFLPAYPLLCLLAAIGVIALVALAPQARRRLVLGVATALVLVQGLVFSVHNDYVLAREDTRELAREWLVANVPEGSKVVIEPVVPDQWAQDPGRPSRVTGNGNRWIKWATSRSRVTNEGKVNRGGRGRRVKLEDYERTTRPELVGSYSRGGFCFVLTGSTQYGRAEAEPDEVPNALRYYAELERRGDLVYRVSPWGKGDPIPFSFDSSFNWRPLRYDRPGPEIRIYRLRTCDRD